jgi:hypothetical protein
MGKSTTFILNLQENLANLKLDFKFTKNPFTLSFVTLREQPTMAIAPKSNSHSA